MRTEDHRALAGVMTEHINISKWKKAAFAFGHIEPDYNRFSYMGHRQEYFSNGHSYHCRKKQICAFMKRPYRDTVLWWYRAGRIFHFMEDSFTRPHNPEFGYKSADHIKYEIELHDIVQRALQGNPWKIPKVDREFGSWLELRHLQYMERSREPEDDCFYIYTTMMAVWNWMVAEKIS